MSFTAHARGDAAPTGPRGRPARATTARALAVATALVGALLLPALAAGAGTARPTDADRRPATGAAWLADQLTPGGYIEGFGGTPSYGSTMQTALALAAAGTEEAAFDAIVAFLAADPLSAVDDGGGQVQVQSLGTLLLIVDAAGADPTSFGGVDLVALLQGTLGLHTAGLYGATDPTYDGAYRQSLALLGLLAADVAPPAAAVAWLVDQQCDDATPAAQGGWEPYRASTAVPCAVPDPDLFVGADTNQTALAVQALAALDVTPTWDALAFLAAAQATDGGFPYLPGGVVDPNSTALVIQALAAVLGPDGVAAFAGPGGDPVGSLLAWQVPCGQAEAGAFTSPFSGGDPDQFASQQGVWGAAVATFPLGPVTFVDGGDPCAEAPATTTTTAGQGSTTPTPSTTVVAVATVATSATPVTATATFTG